MTTMKLSKMFQMTQNFKIHFSFHFRSFKYLRKQILSITQNIARMKQSKKSLIYLDLYPRSVQTTPSNLSLSLSHKNSTQYHVFELSRQLPRFTLYLQAPPNTPPPKSFVSFPVNERINRVVMWINQNFLLDEEVCAVSS